jgi:hypothetical protein
MPAATQVHAGKVRAYLATRYRFNHAGQDIVLTIGQRSAALAALFASHNTHCAAFITAFNPRGCIQSDAQNQLAHQQLGEQLQALALPVIEGAGSAADSSWPSERSYLALGLELQPARDIGNHFAQDAIVWIGADLVPQLALLR